MSRVNRSMQDVGQVTQFQELSNGIQNLVLQTKLAGWSSQCATVWMPSEGQSSAAFLYGWSGGDPKQR